MMYLCLTVLLVFLLVLIPVSACAEEYRDIYPDTWVGSDALGRTMPTSDEVGPPKDDKERVVGIFYITWHTPDRAAGEPPYKADVTKILHAAPEARLDCAHPAWDGDKPAGYHFAEPEMGYFLSQDRYVIRRDMSMLVDAGVDVLIMDVTNAVRYWDEWEVTFDEMMKMKAEGNKVPKFCFWVFNGPAITVVQHLYGEIYKQEKYKDLWFYWDGKPLMLYNGRPDIAAVSYPLPHANPYYDEEAVNNPDHPHYGDPFYTTEAYDDYPQEIKDFFTLRTMWWGYYEWAGERFIGTEGNWSFGYGLDDARTKEMYPHDLIAPWQGEPEQAAVTPAQHSSSMVGKSWSREHGQPELDEHDMPVSAYVPWLGEEVDRPTDYGIYFQERWDEALASDPRFIYVNDWNEWTAGKYHLTDTGLHVHIPPEEERRTLTFMRRESSYMFIDQYNKEFNRGIQPLKRHYTDNYYMQMAQNIRRYKGVRPIPEHKGIHAITINNGNFDAWKAIDIEYRDTVGDTMHRDHPGYQGLHYVDDSGRNDIITSKVAVDTQHVYFYVETNEDLAPHTDDNWMLLFINIDCDARTGWYGYNYLVNKNILDEHATTLMQWQEKEGKGDWVEIAKLSYHYAGSEMEIAIPRDILELHDDQITFDFKWADNPADLDNPLSLIISGDTAPNRRFNYRFIWTK